MPRVGARLLTPRRVGPALSGWAARRRLSPAWSGASSRFPFRQLESAGGRVALAIDDPAAETRRVQIARFAWPGWRGRARRARRRRTPRRERVAWHGSPFGMPRPGAIPAVFAGAVADDESCRVLACRGRLPPPSSAARTREGASRSPAATSAARTRRMPRVAVPHAGDRREARARRRRRSRRERVECRGSAFGMRRPSARGLPAAMRPRRDDWITRGRERRPTNSADQPGFFADAQTAQAEQQPTRCPANARDHETDAVIGATATMGDARPSAARRSLKARNTR